MESHQTLAHCCYFQSFFSSFLFQGLQLATLSSLFLLKCFPTPQTSEHYFVCHRIAHIERNMLMININENEFSWPNSLVNSFRSVFVLMECMEIPKLLFNKLCSSTMWIVFSCFCCCSCCCRSRCWILHEWNDTRCMHIAHEKMQFFSFFSATLDPSLSFVLCNVV